MTLWCHGWGCKALLTTSLIHIRSIKSAWAPSYAVDGHIGAPLQCYTCAGGGQRLENWGNVEPKWHCGVMVEAVNHHWLHPTSILDGYKVFEHLQMLWMGVWVHPYTVIPVQVGAEIWKIGVRRSPNQLTSTVWHKPLTTVPYYGTYVPYNGTFWHTRLRSDARRVIGPDCRVSSEVADAPHHNLGHILIHGPWS